MLNLFYRMLVYLSGKCGIWVLYTAVWIIASGYFIFFPRRVAVSARFYRAVFPHRPAWYPLWCAWRQFHNFTTVYIDRYLLEYSDDINYTAQGWQYIEQAALNRTGGILLMSHLGNWEVAARLLKKHGIPLLLFMGQKQGEQIEGIQKTTLQKNGVEIVASSKGKGSPTDILEGVRYLRKGWILSIAGDRSADAERSFVEAEFFGHTVKLPETPYALALATGVPVFVFFAFRTKKRRYHFIIHQPIYIKPGSREMRKQCMRDAAQKYARLLEQAVCEYPFQWHHFKQFLGPKTKNRKNSDQKTW